MDKESQYHYTYMVPFPFLENTPNRKKPWEKFLGGDLTESEEEKMGNLEESIQKDGVIGKDGLGISTTVSESDSSYEDFVSQMEEKVNEKKRKESQSISVVMM